jgi:MoxR-like ATPase
MAAGFLARLGIVGWSALEPLVLAALATEAPVLLVGAHGTAKSLLVERLAGALGLVFRHYNASLVSYDDLVGIPLPADTGSGLRFVGTEGAIWGAGFVFRAWVSARAGGSRSRRGPVS